jgi:hypothetical protein
MKKIAGGLAILIFIGVIVLSIQGGSMREIRTEIQIAAPVDQVWQVLTEFDNWKEWNPTINQAGGRASVGSILNITIRGKEGEDASNYQPVVLESDAPNSFRWRATMMAAFVFKNDRVFVLTAKDGGTHLVHTEEFTGLMVPLMWKKLEDFVEPTLEKMNQALVKKVESSL